MDIPIGFNPVTQKFDCHYSEDFKESNTRSSGIHQSIDGRPTKLSSHRFDEGSDIWDDEDTKSYWSWE